MSSYWSSLVVAVAAVVTDVTERWTDKVKALGQYHTALCRPFSSLFRLSGQRPCLHSSFLPIQFLHKSLCRSLSAGIRLCKEQEKEMMYSCSLSVGVRLGKEEKKTQKKRNVQQTKLLVRRATCDTPVTMRWLTLTAQVLYSYTCLTRM